MKIYGIYDEKNKEQCVRVGTLAEVVNFLDISARTVSIALNKHKYIKKRYKLYYLFEE